jgi:hypothetical protein
VGEDGTLSAVRLKADPRSLQVREGSHGSGWTDLQQRPWQSPSTQRVQPNLGGELPVENTTASSGQCVQLPVLRDALERVGAVVFEPQAGARGEIADGA